MLAIHNPVGSNRSNPVYAIGGIGGSGTRLVAMLMSTLGFTMGRHLNTEMDNLYFTLLFKRPEILNMDNNEFAACVDLFLGSLYGRQPCKEFVAIIKKAAQSHPAGWSESVSSHFIRSFTTKPENSGFGSCTGWKEPNTHIIIDRLYQCIPSLKYIHVIRHGLDMAYSNNKRQALLWGKYLLDTEPYDTNPPYLLRYWCAVHKRMQEFSSQWASDRPVFWLNYDKLLTDPVPILHAFLEFLGMQASENTIDTLQRLINGSSSSGKYIQQDLSIFSVEDVAYVESLGFTIHQES